MPASGFRGTPRPLTGTLPFGFSEGNLTPRGIANVTKESTLKIVDSQETTGRKDLRYRTHPTPAEAD